MTTNTTDTRPAVTHNPSAAEARRVEQVCAQCGGTDVVMESAVRWDVGLQAWQVSAVYDKSGHCGDCLADVSVDERELPPATSLASYTVFVRQANGQGTTHVSAHDAASPAEAEQLALAETAADWSDEVDSLAVLGVIAGDVDLLSWDDALWA